MRGAADARVYAYNRCIKMTNKRIETKWGLDASDAVDKYAAWAKDSGDQAD